ncbi:MAG TPA: LacI family DNA-binding transcriptional regulator [Cyclobacteriaceae bacterium]|nr:LacI family DNA-binding transcriptional regulator [Cyclobacteriaceae bacterium]
MGITIRKIAKDLNLAVSTVSKAFSDSHEISAETKRKVLDYARKLDYVPNPYASSLKGRRSGNIAVVLPEVADSFFSIAINGIESVAQERGYHVMVYLTHEDKGKEKSIVRDFRSGRVDGVLISVSCGSEDISHFQDLISRKIPLVFFDRVSEESSSSKVVTDDFESGFNATEHLIERGCTRIAFLAMSRGLNIVDQRMSGYKKALIIHDQETKEENIISCPTDDEESLQIIRRLMGRGDRPDGIVASVEKLATQTYAVCNELDLRIPNDVKVIAFSSMQIAALLQPPLTTITQPAYEIGRAAATLLFRSLLKKGTEVDAERIVLPSVLIDRSSTR